MLTGKCFGPVERIRNCYPPYHTTLPPAPPPPTIHNKLLQYVYIPWAAMLKFELFQDLHLSNKYVNLCMNWTPTRTTRTPAYWDTPAAPWLPILVIHIRSQVKTRQSQSYKILKNCQKFKFWNFSRTFTCNTPFLVAWYNLYRTKIFKTLAWQIHGINWEPLGIWLKIGAFCVKVLFSTLQKFRKNM